ncbi:nucleotidyltransferase family protein [Aneurinibacillus migulanus]|uniref:nucleotidyltransferase family protein n=1 Tax=Aneurinibacillus migulanus TaxID=47500 RepID=UPI00209F45A3|nr:nucleotidyltransferase family protein [Aneurinibacillus migulanus]MCP1357613.1 nucleotidyltransferase family protein [Aneurinibacillus migulanus]
MQPNIAALILAAGASSRMGKPKQLLELDGKYMLERVIRLALSAEFTEVVAVVGCQSERIRQLIRIEDTRFRWEVNLDALMGQSTSLQAGFRALGEAVEGVMVLLGDQPFISEKTVRRVFEEGSSILNEVQGSFVIQPSFQGKIGHPVFFVRPPYADIFYLQGDQGAKGILEKLNGRILVPVVDEGIVIDLDTPQDVKQYSFKSEK